MPTGFTAPVPTDVRLGGLLLFPAGPGRSVLVRAVVVDAALAAFHEAVHAVAPGGLETSLPGSWSPHVTLARRVRDEDLPRAVAALRTAPLPDDPSTPAWIARLRRSTHPTPGAPSSGVAPVGRGSPRHLRRPWRSLVG